MRKIKINMLSYANSVKGQGVGTAYLELMNLLKNNKSFDIDVNKGLDYDVMHVHTMDPISFIKHFFN